MKLPILVLAAFAVGVTGCVTTTRPITPCTSSAECPTSSPYCDPAIGGGCTGCRIDDHCVDYPASPRCEVDSGLCAECVTQEECIDVSASQCAAGRCAPCTENVHCDGIAGKPICDDRECVEACSVQTEAADCGSKSCNPATMACTFTVRGSVEVCRPCVADSECGDGANNESDDHRCIELTFMGTSQGGRCLRARADGDPECERPYLPTITRPSLSSDEVDDYCGIKESLTTCEAILFIGGTCDPGESDCEGGGASCESISGGNLCTYACELATECTTELPNCPAGFCTVPPS